MTTYGEKHLVRIESIYRDADLDITLARENLSDHSYVLFGSARGYKIGQQAEIEFAPNPSRWKVRILPESQTCV